MDHEIGLDRVDLRCNSIEISNVNIVNIRANWLVTLHSQYLDKPLTDVAIRTRNKNFQALPFLLCLIIRRDYTSRDHKSRVVCLAQADNLNRYSWNQLVANCAPMS